MLGVEDFGEKEKMMPQIDQKLLNNWEKKGNLIVIWRCERCFKKIPFFESANPLINSIYLHWARNHKYCPECKKKIENKNNPRPKEYKSENKRIICLLEKYELPLEEDEFLI